MTIIDRKNDGQDGVGEWFYDFFECGIIERNEDTINNLGTNPSTKILDSILKGLTNNYLFNIKKIDVSGFKLTDSKKESIQNFSFTINLENKATTIKGLMRPFFNQLKNINISFIKIHSSTNIFSGNIEKKALDNVFMIDYGGFGINIVTDCDVWLPYDLKGESQQKLYELNAPRLKKALQEIENDIGVEPTWDHTKYAYVDKYNLRNIMEDGKALNVYDA